MAFANARGGRLLIGIDESARKLASTTALIGESEAALKSTTVTMAETNAAVATSLELLTKANGLMGETGDSLRRAVGLIEDVCGSFDQPGSGILFTVPISAVRGLAGELSTV